MPPIHHVNLNCGACRFTFAGCKWRKTLEMTFNILFLGVSEKPCRKTDSHTFDRKTLLRTALKNPSSFKSLLYFLKNVSFCGFSMDYTFKNAPGLSHSPRSPLYRVLSSTMICPSSPNATLNRSRGLGAGPSMLIPSGVKPLP